MSTKSPVKLIIMLIFLAMVGITQTGLAQSDPLNNVEATWIDVRSPEEFEKGHVEGAINIHFEDIVAGVDELGLQSDDVIYLYCGSGRRAGLALKTLEASGYSNVVNIGGLEQAMETFENPAED